MGTGRPRALEITLAPAERDTVERYAASRSPPRDRVRITAFVEVETSASVTAG